MAKRGDLGKINALIGGGVCTVFSPAVASHALIRGGSVFEMKMAGCWLLAIILRLV